MSGINFVGGKFCSGIMAEIHEKKLFKKGSIVHGLQVSLAHDEPVRLDCGVDLRDINVAYQTYGRLNA